jgi:hypothetical protein
MQLPNVMDMFPGAKKDGGAKKASKKAPKKSAKATKAPKKAATESTKPKRTSQKIVGSDGKPHTVYKKDGVSFIRKKSSKTGKFYYSRVTKA